jgi:hypothetical protein
MSTGNTTTGAFDALLADLYGAEASLTKATAGDDGKIAAAAEEGAAGGEGAAGAEEKAAEGAAGATMVKAIDANGDEVEAIDATEFLKSMQDGQTAFQTQALDVLGRQGALIKSLVAQVGALTGQVKELSTKGVGRRALLTLHERPAAADLAKSLESGEGAAKADEQPKLNAKEFLTKALQAAEEGKITYHEANHCETLINRGAQPPADIVAAVMA